MSLTNFMHGLWPTHSGLLLFSLVLFLCQWLHHNNKDNDCRSPELLLSLLLMVSLNTLCLYRIFNPCESPIISALWTVTAVFFLKSIYLLDSPITRWCLYIYIYQLQCNLLHSESLFRKVRFVCKLILLKDRYYRK